MVMVAALGGGGQVVMPAGCRVEFLNFGQIKRGKGVVRRDSPGEDDESANIMVRSPKPAMTTRTASRDPSHMSGCTATDLTCSCELRSRLALCAVAKHQLQKYILLLLLDRFRDTRATTETQPASSTPAQSQSLTRACAGCSLAVGADCIFAASLTHNVGVSSSERELSQCSWKLSMNSTEMTRSSITWRSSVRASGDKNVALASN